MDDERTILRPPGTPDRSPIPGSSGPVIPEGAAGGRPPRPSIADWLAEIKASPVAGRVGMYLVHNGVVRGTARDGSPVIAMDLSCDREHLAAIVRRIESSPGIAAVRVWVGEGRLAVGDDIMYALVAGDIRENVLNALQELVGLIKSEVVCEKEIRPT